MKRISVCLLVLFFCFSMVFSASAVELDTVDEYKDIFEEYIMKNTYEYPIFKYKNIYEHYELKADHDEKAIPDYVFVFASDGPPQPAEVKRFIGDFLLFSNGWYTPYDLGFFVYVPASKTIYTLEEAYEAKVSGIDKAFEHLGYHCVCIGDMNCDKEIDIKDATILQKTLANLPVAPVENNKEYVWIGDYLEELQDFNGDKKVNIRDATAIQKHIAKMDY